MPQRARLYIDWSPMEALSSHRRLSPSGKELATASCHIEGVTYTGAAFPYVEAGGIWPGTAWTLLDWGDVFDIW